MLPKSTKFLEIYSQYLWPIARKFVKLSRRCSRCILSEKHSPLKNGLCPECAKNPQIAQYQAPSASEDMVQQFQHVMNSHIREQRYDALLLLSGGKDSVYILHRLQQEFPKLKILCTLINNGFTSPIAIANATHAAEKLKTDLLIFNAKIDEFAAVFRKAFLSLNGRGSSGVIDFADGELIFKTGRAIARGYHIPLMIAGLSWIQVQHIAGIDTFEQSEGPDLKLIFPLAVWRTNEFEIRQKVCDLGLIPPGSDSPLVSNNHLILTMSAIDVLNNGYCSFEVEFAQMIREGRSERKTWLHIFELLEYATTRGYLNEDIQRNLSKLNLLLSDIVKERI